MLMVVTENGWSNIVYDYTDKFQSLVTAMLFYHSFYMLVKYIILSLLTGLVWEIFTIISNNLGKKNTQPNKDPNAPVAEPEDHSDSEDEEDSEEGSGEVVLDLEELVKPTNDNIAFLKRKLKETKKDNLKMHEVVLMRDDYSFAHNPSLSIGSYKQIDGNA